MIARGCVFCYGGDEAQSTSARARKDWQQLVREAMMADPLSGVHVFRPNRAERQADILGEGLCMLRNVGRRNSDGQGSKTRDAVVGGAIVRGCGRAGRAAGS